MVGSLLDRAQSPSFELSLSASTGSKFQGGGVRTPTFAYLARCVGINLFISFEAPFPHPVHSLLLVKYLSLLYPGPPFIATVLILRTRYPDEPMSRGAAVYDARRLFVLRPYESTCLCTYYSTLLCAVTTPEPPGKSSSPTSSASLSHAYCLR